VRIGPDIFNDEKPFYIMEKNTWFAAAPAPQSKFTLITHCVSPGWVPEDDIPGYFEDMVKLSPQHSDFIKEYSWPKNRKEYVQHDDYKK
jgi:predicted cupin superfamily sugar epimerase